MRVTKSAMLLILYIFFLHASGSDEREVDGHGGPLQILVSKREADGVRNRYKPYILKREADGVRNRYKPYILSMLFAKFFLRDLGEA
ncbi:hypothetical protein Y032_0004g1727 [Ancylostoma ceylanicum]|uniref:Uncharacterized protein n=1 Tax=Ancylostoma ceylanicum TaxID=53326 RepID=A0A016VT02_9BILA|nr:hypothetical protein Y032_0004g1727 [Ancylostoma ceylanicum]